MNSGCFAALAAVFSPRRRYASVLLAVLLLALQGCAWMRGDLIKPEVAISGLRLGPSQGLYQSVYVDLMITNPNKVALQLDAITYRVRLQGRDLVNGISREPLDVPAGGTASYTVPASVNVMNSMGLIKDVLLKPRGEIRYELDATLEPTGFFALPINVKKTDSISLTR